MSSFALALGPSQVQLVGQAYLRCAGWLVIKHAMQNAGPV